MKSIFSTLLSMAFVFAALTAHSESETIKGAKADLTSFKKDISAKLDAVDKQLTELKEKAKAKGSKVSDKTVHELEEARSSLRARLEEVKDDSQTGWANMKANIAKSMDDLNKKVQEAMK